VNKIPIQNSKTSALKQKLMMAAQAAHRSDRLAKTASVQDRGVDIAAGHRIANTKQAESIFSNRMLSQ
jgi:hypothetical protein